MTNLTQKPSEVVVGFTYPASAATTLVHFMHLNAAKLGLRLVDWPASTPEEQVESIRLAKGIAALLVVAVANGDALTAALAERTQAGIPSISLSSSEAVGSGSIYFAELEAQAALARHVFERIGGRGTVAYLHGDDLPTDAPHLRGIRAALEVFPEITLTVSTSAPESSARWVRELVTKHPEMSAILTASDDLAVEAIDALGARGLTNGPLVAGFGGSPEAFLAVEQGQMSATVKLDLDALTTSALKAAIRAVNPGQAAPDEPVTFEVVTRENVGRATVRALRIGEELTRDMARRMARGASEDRQTAEFLDSVIDTIPLMVFVKDAKELRYLRINKAREEWFGIDRLQHLGKNAYDIYPRELAERFEASDRAVLNGVPEVDSAGHPTMTASGPRYVFTRKLPIYGPDGKPRYLVGSSFDITERRLAELALDVRNTQLQAAIEENELKTVALLKAERERVEHAAALLNEGALERTRAMEIELETARRIQTSILPRQLYVAGLDIAALMNPATEVGGDYYDIMPTEEGCWIGIGDVTGHGLGSGLIMLMTQSIAAALSKTNPMASPSAVLQALNSVLFENIRKRMLENDHVTLTLLRYMRNGKVVFAGAHEDILVCRADGTVECVPTPGTWVGAVANIEHATSDSVIELRQDDVMVLYTDGVTEAMSAVKEQFGLDRLGELVARSRREPVGDIAQRVIDALRSFRSTQRDDETVVVTRYSAAT